MGARFFFFLKEGNQEVEGGEGAKIGIKTHVMYVYRFPMRNHYDLQACTNKSKILTRKKGNFVSYSQA